MPDVIDYFGTGHDGGEWSFLSNFYWWNGWTIEHHYQAMKTNSPSWAVRILSARTPGEAKKLGRQAPMRARWDEQKVIVMQTLVRLKFATSPELTERLLATRPAMLIEGNTWGDRFWGKVDGVGDNWLGLILMAVRTELFVIAGGGD